LQLNNAQKATPFYPKTHPGINPIHELQLPDPGINLLGLNFGFCVQPFFKDGTAFLEHVKDLVFTACVCGQDHQIPVGRLKKKIDAQDETPCVNRFLPLVHILMEQGFSPQDFNIFGSKHIPALANPLQEKIFCKIPSDFPIDLLTKL